jgi:VIT1/CCC1 family predicted Fe2+/Mn2+ transporter
MLLGALGCNLAWGVIDGIMYLMGCLAERARSLATIRNVRKTADQQKAHRLIVNSLPSTLASIMPAAEFEVLRQQITQLPEPPTHPRLTKNDWRGAFGVFLLVVLSTFPVVFPFFFGGSVTRANRLSNAIAIVMLFLTGYAFGRCTGYHPRGMGIVMVALGLVLVGITIALGG